MNKHKLKSGFTLVELMIFFIFVSLLLAASAPIITKRVKNLPLRVNHGRFVCYGDQSQYFDRHGNPVGAQQAGCTFNPPKRATLYKIELLGGGAGGYDYLLDPSDVYSDRTATYTLDGTQSRENNQGYSDLTNEEVLAIFYGATIEKYRKGTSGDRGGSVTSEPFTTTDSASLRLADDSGFTLEGDYLVKGTTPPAPPTAMNWFLPAVLAAGPPPTAQTKVLYSDFVSAIKKAEQKIRNLEYCDASSHGLAGGTCYYLHLAKEPEAEDIAKGITVPGTIGGLSVDSISVPAMIYHWGQFQQYLNDEKHTVTASGASGGSGIMMQLSATIDRKDYDAGETGPLVTPSNIKPYLKKVSGKYAAGTTRSAGSCAGWGYSAYNEHDGTFSIKGKIDNYNNTLDSSEGKWGRDVMHYDAMRAWDRCATNSTRATGGQGGLVKTNNTDYLGYVHGYNRKTVPDDIKYVPDGSLRTPGKGTNAEGLEGTTSRGGTYTISLVYSSDNLRTTTPTGKVVTHLTARHHEVGRGGGAGKYAVYYASDLTGCNFNVGSGGKVIDSSWSDSLIASEQDSLKSTLSCNNGRLNYSADGGKYFYIASGDVVEGQDAKVYRTNETGKEIHDGFSLLNANGTFKTLDAYTTQKKGQTGSLPASVFTKISNYILGNNGSGGDGPLISDSCTEPKGYYVGYLITKIDYYSYLKSDETKTEERIPKKWFERTQECGGDNVSVSSATAGSPGLIMISW